MIPFTLKLIDDDGNFLLCIGDVKQIMTRDQLHELAALIDQHVWQQDSLDREERFKRLKHETK